MSKWIMIASEGSDVDPNSLDENNNPKPARRVEVAAAWDGEVGPTPNGPAFRRLCSRFHVYGYGARQSLFKIKLRNDGEVTEWRTTDRAFGPKDKVYVVDQFGHDNDGDLVHEDGELVVKDFKATDAAGTPIEV